MGRNVCSFFGAAQTVGKGYLGDLVWGVERVSFVGCPVHTYQTEGEAVCPKPL